MEDEGEQVCIKESTNILCSHLLSHKTRKADGTPFRKATQTSVPYHIQKG